MPVPATGDDLIELVRKSGLVEPSRLDAYLAKLGPPPEAGLLAEKMVVDGVLSGFQAEQLSQGRWKRFFIGKYKILERLGRGGMANVFLCEHKLMRRRVAVKVLPAVHARDGSALERFYREARAVAAVDHPNLVRAYDIDQDDNLHFLVMEFVDGVNLYDLVRRGGPVSPERAAHYVAGAAVGLQHAHEMGLVHRDIKPGNILVDRAGAVKVLDLGLALFFHPDDDDQLTKKYDETVVGTADYLAPEQALDSHTVDIRADIYSLGGTLYYLLTGRPPFPEGNVAQKLVAHQQREPVPIAELRPDVPPGLILVFEKMAKKDPAARYQTPADVVAALARWTATPVAPPSEDDLPKFGPASMGTNTLAVRPQPGSGASVVTARVAPAAPVPPTPPDKPETDVWGAITADTHAEPAAKAKPKTKTKGLKKPVVKKRNAGRNKWLAAGLFVLALALLAVGYTVTRKANAPPTVPTKALKMK